MILSHFKKVTFNLLPFWKGGLKKFEVKTEILKLNKKILFIFRLSLTRHKKLASEFLEKNYEKFFTVYELMLASQNYATRRQYLKLLRNNFIHSKVLSGYDSNEQFSDNWASKKIFYYTFSLQAPFARVVAYSNSEKWEVIIPNLQSSFSKLFV